MSDLLAGWIGETFHHRPNDIAGFARALTHGSQAADNYERLEFLGDRVLGLAMAEWLYELFPNEPEGGLSKRLNALVTGHVCADVARAIGVQPHLRLGKQARDDGASDSDNVLGDVMEALIGALYLDADLATVHRVVRALYGPLPDRLAGMRTENPKGRLQELIQPLHGNDAVRYEVTRVEGADHARAYEVAVFVRDRRVGAGRGTSKKLAEEAAAAAALETLADEAES